MKIIIQRPGADDTIDMTVDGQFISPPPPSLADRIFRAAVMVAAIAGAVAIAALALWFAIALIPVLLVAGVVAWAAWRWQLWRMPRRF